MSTYLEQRRELKLNGKPLAVKKVYSLPKQSEKKKAELTDIKKDKANGILSPLDIWFNNTRVKLTGFCACGCGEKSQKNDNKYYRHCCCHIFPKSKFKSIATHPQNYVERAFLGGCHSVMDDTSMERWPNMEDWETIKAKFYLLSPLIPAKEKANKFYGQLERLVHDN